MVPAHQCFAAVDFTAGHVHLGLEPCCQFALFQGIFQVAAQFLLQQGVLAHFFVIEHQGAAHGQFGVSAGVVGQIQHEMDVVLFRGIDQVHAEDRAYFVGHALGVAPDVQRLGHVLGPGRQLLPAVIAQHQDEVVRGHAGATLVLADAVPQNGRVGAEQFVAHGKAEVVVDDLELADVAVEQDIFMFGSAQQATAFRIEFVEIVQAGQAVAIEQGLNLRAVSGLDGQAVGQQQNDQSAHHPDAADDFRRMFGHKVP